MVHGFVRRWRMNLKYSCDSFLASLLVHMMSQTMKENPFISQHCVCSPAACLIDLNHISLINLLLLIKFRQKHTGSYRVDRFLWEKLLVDDRTENARPVVMCASAWATQSYACCAQQQRRMQGRTQCFFRLLYSKERCCANLTASYMWPHRCMTRTEGQMWMNHCCCWQMFDVHRWYLTVWFRLSVLKPVWGDVQKHRAAVM